MDDRLTNAIKIITTWNSTADPSAVELEQLDSAYTALAVAYLQGDASMRDALRRAMPTEGLVLLGLSHRARERAVETRSQEALEVSLAGHCLEDFRWDPRENLVGLKAIWDSADSFGVAPRPLFEKVAAFASERARVHFANFVSNQTAYAPAQKPKRTARKAKLKSSE